MLKYSYRTLVPRRGWLLDVTRRAIYAPLMGPRSVSRPPTNNDLFLLRWRNERFRQLSALGVAWFPTELKLSYAYNCPPFASDGVRGRPCHRSRVCPFCYARDRVYAPLSRVAKFLDGRDFKGLRLVTWTETRSTPFTVASASALLKTFDSDRKSAVQRLRPELAVVSHAFRGTKDKKTLELVRTGLAVVSGGVPPLPGVRDYAVSYANVARVAPGVLGYPAWMLRGDPGRVAWVLQELGRARLLSCYGAARGVDD